MCGRYTLTYSELDLSWLGINKPVHQPPAYNIAPGEQVLVARLGQKKTVELARVKWGLVPSWLEDFSKAQVNARIETASSKPMFREAMASRRCLVLADGWYDWQSLPDRKQPWYIRPRVKQFIAFAGVWERYQVDEHLGFDSCAILTMDAIAPLAPLPGRMPVLTEGEAARDWLTGAINHEQLLLNLEQAHKPLLHYPVSRAVNRVSEKRAVCIRRL